MTSGPFRLCIVCTGNICRSAMAEVVLRRAVEEAGLGDRVVVDSAGTGPWHVGHGADERALAALRRRGFDGSAHVARQWDPAWSTERDLVLAADSGHHRDLLSDPGVEADRVRYLREFDPEADPDDLDLADPYYGDDAGFDTCLRQIERAAPSVVELVRARVDAD